MYCLRDQLADDTALAPSRFSVRQVRPVLFFFFFLRTKSLGRVPSDTPALGGPTRGCGVPSLPLVTPSSPALQEELREPWAGVVAASTRARNVLLSFALSIRRMLVASRKFSKSEMVRKWTTLLISPRRMRIFRTSAPASTSRTARLFISLSISGVTNCGVHGGPGESVCCPAAPHPPAPG